MSSSESQLGKNGRASQLRESNMPKVATFQNSVLVQDPSDQQMSFAGENYMLKTQHHTMMTNSSSESHFARYSKLQNCMNKLSQTDKGRQRFPWQMTMTRNASQRNKGSFFLFNTGVENRMRSSKLTTDSDKTKTAQSYSILPGRQDAMVTILDSEAAGVTTIIRDNSSSRGSTH